MVTYWVRLLAVINYGRTIFRNQGKWLCFSTSVLLAGSLVPFAVQADTYTPNNVFPTQYFDTLQKAEGAMKAVSTNAALLQYDRFISGGIYTTRFYVVPPVAVSAPFWVDCGNTLGPNYLYDSGQAVCDAARTYHNWPSYLTYSPNDISQDKVGTSLGSCRQMPTFIVLGYPSRAVTCPSGYRLVNYTGLANYCPGTPGIGFGANAICKNGTTATIDVVAECPIKEWTKIEDIPPNGPDVLPLTQLLEQTRGSNLALTTNTETARQCLITKATALGVTLAGFSGTRTIAYQAHLRDLWDKMIAHNKLVEDFKISDPAKVEACRPRRNRVIAEKGCSSSGVCIGTCILGSHCIRGEPEGNSHVDGLAFDVSMDSIDSLDGKLALRTPPQSITEMLAVPTACRLKYGGTFTVPGPDYVHFVYQ